MSTNKLSHLKEGEKIYLEVTREISTSDDSMGLMFCGTSSFTTFVNDDDTFYTLDDLKQLANDNIPKQGDEIEVRTYSTEKEWEIKTVSHTALITTDGKPYALGQWRYPQKKTELTKGDKARHGDEILTFHRPDGMYASWRDAEGLTRIGQSDEYVLDDDGIYIPYSE